MNSKIWESIEDLLATKEPQIRSRTAKAGSGFGFLALSGLSLWLAPSLGLKITLLAIWLLLWIALWLLSRLAIQSRQIRSLKSEIRILRGDELESSDWTVLNAIYEKFPDTLERDEIVDKTGISLNAVSLSLRNLMSKKFIDKNLVKQLRGTSTTNPNGYWITRLGEKTVKSKIHS